MTPARLPASIAGLSALADRYDLLLCDIWGVVHNGVAAHMAACEALQRFRAAGGRVVLVSNAPRPSPEIELQLASLGVPVDVRDAIVTSGDVTLSLMRERAGLAPYHLGPARDLALFSSAALHPAPLPGADYVVCTGLVDDDTETPDDYADLLAEFRRRDMPMICANPDLIVERGERTVYCAGALADRYHEAGGEVIYAGKPHRPIYETARALAEARHGRAIAIDRVLAIGDAIRTDVTGAHGFGVDALFVTAGIHAAELHTLEGEIALAALPGFFSRANRIPEYLIRKLAW